VPVKFKPTVTIEEAYYESWKLLKVKLFRKLLGYWTMSVITYPVIQLIFNKIIYDVDNNCYIFYEANYLLIGLISITSCMIFTYSGFVINSIIFTSIMLISWLLCMLLVSGSITENIPILAMIGASAVQAARIQLDTNAMLASEVLFRRCGIIGYAVLMLVDKITDIIVYIFPEIFIGWYEDQSSKTFNIPGYVFCVLAVGGMYVSILVQKGLVKRNL